MASDLERLRAAYASWDASKGLDATVWLDIFADELIFTSCGGDHPGLAFAKPRQSKAEVAAYFGELAEQWSMIHYTPHVFLQDGDHIAMFGRCAWRSNATGKAADVQIAGLWRFEDGRVIEYTELFDTAQAAAAATP